MEHVDLFPLLHNRMNREEQSVPEYIGEFDGVASLPTGDYPAIYFGLIAKIQIVSDSPLTRQSLNVGVWRRQ